MNYVVMHISILVIRISILSNQVYTVETLYNVSIEIDFKLVISTLKVPPLLVAETLITSGSLFSWLCVKLHLCCCQFRCGVVRMPTFPSRFSKNIIRTHPNLCVSQRFPHLWINCLLNTVGIGLKVHQV